MRGDIINLDALGGGIISGDDGARYTFTADQARGAVRAGDRVDFLGLDGVASDVLAVSPSHPGSGPAASRAAFGSAPDGPSYAGAYAGAGPGYNFGWSMFSFEGRLRRSHFWINWAILFVGGFILGLIPFLGFLISLAALWPQFAIQVKRLHDMGRSGWLVLAPIAINIVLIIVLVMSVGVAGMMNAQALEREDPAALMALLGPMMGVVLVGLIVNIGWLIWIGATDSQPGRNRFGPNPKAPHDDPDVFS